MEKQNLRMPGPPMVVMNLGPEPQLSRRWLIGGGEGAGTDIDRVVNGEANFNVQFVARPVWLVKYVGDKES
jgi:hypothetical protein